ncbi:telomeric DNA binding protein [Tricholoma matsutake]|nr:telomeric DNA binding protein [Tricholoma matsutake 945]
MHTKTFNDNSTVVRDVIDRLQRPISDLPTLLALLSGPLDRLGSLPPQFRRYNREPLLTDSVDVLNHISSLQRTLLDYIAPTWDTVLLEKDAIVLLEQYFCPDNLSFGSPTAANVVLLAYGSILSQSLTKYGIDMLDRMTTEYPVDRLHPAFFSHNDRETPSKGILGWEDYVRNIVMIPAKVANAIAGKADISSSLEHGSYFNNLCLRCESLMFMLSTENGQDAVHSLSYFLAKLVNVGVFPATPPTSRSQPSFFQTTLPTIRAKLQAEDFNDYSNFWSSVLLGLPTNFTLRSVLISLFASLSAIERAVDSAPPQRVLVKREAYLLSKIVGYLTPQKEELWESAIAIISGRNWDVGRARIFVCWVSGGSQGGPVDEQVIGAFLDKVLEIWTSPEHIKHSLLSHHLYLTALLLIAVSYLSTSSPYLHSLALSPAFISSIGTYVSHLDVSVRRSGMLAAEVVAKLCGKTLDFKDWDENGPGQPWARAIRALIQQRDIDADLNSLESIESNGAEISQSPSQGRNSAKPMPSEPSTVYDSDDSITGYASPPSSRSVSPTPSELQEIEKDPSLAVGVTKVSRPVYLSQLGEMLRGTGGPKAKDGPHEADKIEMALNCAAELIRKKRSYGTELDENAVNLVYGLIGLQNNYDLDGFNEKRQNAMNGLIACCPRKAAPALIEEFFKNQYSTSQRYAALNALALGARELASLPIPPSNITQDRLAFPSKTLPAELHQKYLAAKGQDVVQLIMDNISHQTLERGTDNAVEKLPEPVRERRLRLKQPPGIVKVSQPPDTLLVPLQTPKETTFTEVATEYFIAPLIHRFWQFLRDEQTREERSAHQEGRHRYHGAGTGLILNPVVLAHFLRTLAVVVHAAQNSPEWLAVVAPDALEIAVTLGTKPMSLTESDNEDANEEDGGSRSKEASVLTSALELALVVLDGCLEVDGGRAIGLEHATLLLGTGEWAGMVFSHIEKGLRTEGVAGVHEVKLRNAAAGVMLKVDDLTSKWRRSMLDIR